MALRRAIAMRCCIFVTKRRNEPNWRSFLAALCRTPMAIHRYAFLAATTRAEKVTFETNIQSSNRHAAGANGSGPRDIAKRSFAST
jgi:hypothetical protein